MFHCNRRPEMTLYGWQNVKKSFILLHCNVMMDFMPFQLFSPKAMSSIATDQCMKYLVGLPHTMRNIFYLDSCIFVCNNEGENTSTFTQKFVKFNTAWGNLRILRFPEKKGQSVKINVKQSCIPDRKAMPVQYWYFITTPLFSRYTSSSKLLINSRLSC